VRFGHHSRAIPRIWFPRTPARGKNSGLRQGVSTRYCLGGQLPPKDGLDFQLSGRGGRDTAKAAGPGFERQSRVTRHRRRKRATLIRPFVAVDDRVFLARRGTSQALSLAFEFRVLSGRDSAAI